jgi:phage replication-related protein YjqB (UPF0714/DUF867 family)
MNKQVAFHGWRHESICIGGTMPDDVKDQIKTAIVDVVSDPTIEVYTDYEHKCPEDFNGNSEENIVNRLSAKGLQIEQCEKARKYHGIDVADVVADVIGRLIKL